VPATEPAKNALSFVLHGSGEHAGNDVAILDYSSRHDFQRLWSLEGFQAKKILILWSRTAHDADLSPVNAEDCLSPIDSAICYAKNQGTPDTWPNICVLDLACEQHRDVPSVKLFNTFREELFPWLHLEGKSSLADILEWYAPESVPVLAESTETPNEPGLLQRLLSWFRGEKRCSPEAVEPSLPAEQEDAAAMAPVDAFLQMARMNLTEGHAGDDYNHHSVANVIGPLVLRGKAASPTLHTEALVALLGSCGLLSPDGLPQRGSDLDDDPVGDGLEILLLDDQASQGWADWVGESLRRATVASLNNPTSLVETIAKALSEADGRDLRFGLSLPGVQGTGQPLLLLDLRLFSGAFAAEKEFYRTTLLPLITEHFLDRDDLAWSAFNSTDAHFEAARKALKEDTFEVESDEHHEALTWLPRIIALSDMSLPIVLFSSTDRRTIVNRLEDCKNVLVSFQKPSLGNLHDPLIRETTLEAFKATIKAAASFGQLREKCHAVKRLADTLSCESVNNREGDLYVELYVDEENVRDEGDDTARMVGGVFAVFRDKDSADSFEDECVRKGLRYYEDRLFKPNVGQPLSKYKDSGARELRQALEASSSPPSLGMVRLDAEDWGDYTLLEDEQFHRLAAALVELFCAESLPAISNQYSVPMEKIVLAVYLGSRVVDAKAHGPGDYTYQQNIEIREYASGDRMLQSMSGRDAFPVVRDALARHQLQNSVSVERAVAVSLPYSGRRKCEVDRVIETENSRVFRFRPWRDCCLSKEPKKNAKLFGRVKRIQRSAGGAVECAWVTIRGLDEDIFCHVRESARALNTVNESDPVFLTYYRGDSYQRRGRDVRKSSVSDVEEWEDTMKYSVSPEFRRGVPLRKFRPDYRALHYVADQMLRVSGASGDEFAHSIPEKGISGQFEETFDEPLRSAIKASRRLDSGLLGAALKAFDPSEEPSGQRARPLARAYLARRLWGELATCSGAEFCGGVSG